MLQMCYAAVTAGLHCQILSNGQENISCCLWTTIFFSSCWSQDPGISPGALVQGPGFRSLDIAWDCVQGFGGEYRLFLFSTFSI